MRNNNALNFNSFKKINYIPMEIQTALKSPLNVFFVF